MLEARIEKDKKLTPEAKADYQKIIREIDTYNAEKMKEVIHKHNIKAIETGNDVFPLISLAH